MNLIIEIPCKDGVEMENNLNKAIDDFSTALKNKGFSKMELIAYNESVESEPIYKITLDEINPGLLCPTCNKGELYTYNGYIWCKNKKCKAIFEQQD